MIKHILIIQEKPSNHATKQQLVKFKAIMYETEKKYILQNNNKQKKKKSLPNVKCYNVIWIRRISDYTSES